MSDFEENLGKTFLARARSLYIPPMPQLPHRQSLVEQVAGIIQEGILSRRWQGTLPARRALSNELQVSRNTIDAAIRSIQKEGLIKGVSRHRPHIVRARRKPSITHPDSVIYLDGRCLEDFAPSYLAEVLTFQQKVQSKGYGFILQTNMAGHTVYTPKSLRTWIKNERATCWVLAYQPPEIQKFFEEAGVATIVVGARSPGVRLPCIDLDLAATARHAANRLLTSGHQHLAFLRPRRVSSDVAAMEEGFEQARTRSSSASLWKFEHDFTEDSVAKCLAGALRKCRDLDAVIVTGVSDAMRCLGYLSAGAKRSREHPMSIISLEGDPLFEWLQPAISFYRTEQHAVSRKLCYWVDRRDRLGPKELALISPKPVFYFPSRI